MVYNRDGLSLFNGTQENNDDNSEDEKNHPDLRYGVYKNPIDGPSWRLEPGEYYNPAWAKVAAKRLSDGFQQRSTSVSRQLNDCQMIFNDGQRVLADSQTTVWWFSTTINECQPTAKRLSDDFQRWLTSINRQPNDCLMIFNDGQRVSADNHTTVRRFSTTVNEWQPTVNCHVIVKIMTVNLPFKNGISVKSQATFHGNWACVVRSLSGCDTIFVERTPILYASCGYPKSPGKLEQYYD